MPFLDWTTAMVLQKMLQEVSFLELVSIFKTNLVEQNSSVYYFVLKLESVLKVSSFTVTNLMLVRLAFPISFVSPSPSFHSQ